MEIVPILLCNYGSSACWTGDGIERYRPLEGAEKELRKRPGAVEIAVGAPDDRQVAAHVAEAILPTRGYREAAIGLREMLASPSMGLDDRASTNRGWNTTPERKQPAAPQSGGRNG